jgi:hypothetical protein
MPVLNPGTTFANGEQLTASDLNLLLQGATFTQSSVDNQSTQLVGTAIVVADGGIIAAKLAADSVTLPKLADDVLAYIGNLPGIKAHCTWDGTLTGTNSPTSGSGVTSITRVSEGVWDVNMSVTAPSSAFTTLASSNPVSNGTFNYSTGAFSSSTTTARVQRERSDGEPADTGSTGMSFAAIW